MKMNVKMIDCADPQQNCCWNSCCVWDDSCHPAVTDSQWQQMLTGKMVVGSDGLEYSIAEE